MEMDEVFKNLPLAEQKKMLDHLAKLPDVRFLSSEEREKYDESIKAVDDYYSGLYGSYVEGEKKGIAKGIAKGMAKGMAKGIAKGMAKGIAKGIAKEKIDTAYRLLSMGMSWSQIMQATGLTEEELEPLQA
ncbi:transposase [Prevotella copri]|uniref:Transposase n=2 Tax=Segatella copri TaxID=165179 RepID=A0AA90V1W9_9BACT|nr:transposase [Segatella copri]